MDIGGAGGGARAGSFAHAATHDAAAQCDDGSPGDSIVCEACSLEHFRLAYGGTPAAATGRIGTSAAASGAGDGTGTRRLRHHPCCKRAPRANARRQRQQQQKASASRGVDRSTIGGLLVAATRQLLGPMFARGNSSSHSSPRSAADLELELAGHVLSMSKDHDSEMGGLLCSDLVLCLCAD